MLRAGRQQPVKAWKAEGALDGAEQSRGCWAKDSLHELLAAGCI